MGRGRLLTEPVSSENGDKHAPRGEPGAGRASPEAPPDGATGRPDGRHPPLEARNLSKRYGGVVALDDVSLRVEAGEVVALVGPNGSGKTTLLRIVGGAATPDGGAVLAAGVDVTGSPVQEHVRRGIVRTLQRTAVARGLTTMQHAEIGATRLRRRGGVVRNLLATPQARAERRDLTARVEKLLDWAGLPAGTPVEELAGGDLRLLAAVTAAASDPTTLLLDEPSSGLSPDEVERLERFIDALTNGGTAVVVVEHNFSLVGRIAHRVVALDAGRILAQGTPQTVAGDPAVIEAYLGTAAASASEDQADPARPRPRDP